MSASIYNNFLRLAFNENGRLVLVSPEGVRIAGVQEVTAVTSATGPRGLAKVSVEMLVVSGSTVKAP